MTAYFSIQHILAVMLWTAVTPPMGVPVGVSRFLASSRFLAQHRHTGPKWQHQSATLSTSVAVHFRGHFRCGSPPFWLLYLCCCFCIRVVAFVFVLWHLYSCCGFFILVVAFVFVLWLLYSCRCFCVRVVAFVFVLWLLYSCCGFCIWPDTSGPP